MLHLQEMPIKEKVLIVGISGVSSSGKTTLARLLRDIWPDSFVLHEDDFYWPDSEIPIKNGVQDWDCFEAIDVIKLRDTLHYIGDKGTIPSEFDSKEDKNSVGESNVEKKVIEFWQMKAKSLMKNKPKTIIAVVDGFLLYSEQMKEVRSSMNVKLLLKANLQAAKRRREARSGYVTLDGFWEDPPGYVDDIVWPNYVKDHSFLFENNDVQGRFDRQVCEGLSIEPVPAQAENDASACLQWACAIIEEAISAPVKICAI